MTAPTAATTVAALDAQNRVQQAANAARVSQAILAYWLVRVDPLRLTQTSGGWLDFSVAAILRGYEQSYQLASAYSQAVQRIEIPGARPIVIPHPTPPPEEQLRRSLSFTGPGKLAVSLQKIPDVQPTDDVNRNRQHLQQIKILQEDARRKAGAAAAASAYKNVQNGGRDTVDQLVREKVAVGYIRVTKEHPCGFCLMLASRGPVYAENSFSRSDPRFTGPGDQKVHDGCGCTLRPIYSLSEDAWTPTARTADDLWGQMLKANPGIGGKDAINAFTTLAREQGIADLTRF